LVVVEAGRLEEVGGGVDVLGEVDVLVAGGNVVEVNDEDEVVDEVKAAVEPEPVDVVGVDEELALAAVARSPI